MAITTPTVERANAVATGQIEAAMAVLDSVERGVKALSGADAARASVLAAYCGRARKELLALSGEVVGS